MPGLFSIGFAPGKRPRASDVAAAARVRTDFAVSHLPDDEESWAELLVNGLTFDLAGLAPGPAPDAPDILHFYGASSRLPAEMVTLSPGPHIGAGRALPPVLRAAASLAVSLSSIGGAVKVCWHAARNAVDRDAFCRAVEAWLAGGVFPALGLTSVYSASEGGMCSEGLDLFIGQEVHLARSDRPPAEDAKLTLRLIDRLVLHGRVSGPVTWAVDAATHVRLEPSGRGEIIQAWRLNA